MDLLKFRVRRDVDLMEEGKKYHMPWQLGGGAMCGELDIAVWAFVQPLSVPSHELCPSPFASLFL